MSTQHVLSLYRSYLRQVRALPHIYLRHFFRIKSADDFRSLLKAKSNGLRKSKLNRVSKDLRRLRAANDGESTAFDRILDVAYGRAGKLRRELIEPLLSDSNTLLPATPRTYETCSPAYSPELAALLTSNISRMTRALQKRHLVSPPGLPGCATSVFGDRLPLGPLSRRREHNIRWCFFKSECKKVYPPLHISLQRPADQPNPPILSTPPFKFGFQSDIALQELLALAESPLMPSSPPSKQRRSQGIQKTSDSNLSGANPPARWLRRRYQALLGRVPLLVSRPLSGDTIKRTHDVQPADNAITPSRIRPSRLRVVDAKDVSWVNDIVTIQSGFGRHK